MRIFRRGCDISVAEQALRYLQVRGPQDTRCSCVAGVVEAETLYAGAGRGSEHDLCQSCLGQRVPLSAHQVLLLKNAPCLRCEDVYGVVILVSPKQVIDRIGHGDRARLGALACHGEASGPALNHRSEVLQRH